MFDFLKKKIKESIESVKKVFVEEAKEEPKEELKEELKEIKKEEQVVESAEEKIEEAITVSAEAEEKIPEEAAEVEKEVLQEVETELKEEEKKVEEKIEETKSAEEKPRKRFLEKVFGKKKEEKKVPGEEKPKTFVEKISHAILEKKLSEAEFDKFFNDFEISLLESNIAYEVIQLLREELKKHLVEKPVARGKVEQTIMKTIEQTFRKILLEQNPEELLKKIKEHKGEPLKILFLGVNGVGKTTSLAKICYWLQQKGYSAVLAASDTFRAASIEQLEKHAANLKVKVIKHKYGADPAAVAFDAIEYAKAHKINCVLIDSAGRQHTNQNLMDELAKLKRVSKPDFTIFVADALTGNDAVEQAREFGKIGFEAIVLGKADVDQKGGAILSVSYVSGKPIIFLGIGQGYKDIETFDREKLLKKLMS